MDLYNQYTYSPQSLLTTYQWRSFKQIFGRAKLKKRIKINFELGCYVSLLAAVRGKFEDFSFKLSYP
jgi:hypothetical protein